MKLLVTLILLLLTVGRIDATAPNTGPVPESCVKLEFSNKLVTNVEPSSWELMASEEEVVITKGLMLVRLTDFVFKDDEEVIGFTWEVKHATVNDFTVKHGRTVLSYGTEFITTDRKGVSNAVWCLTEIIEEEPEDEEPEEPPVDEEPEDEEPPVDDEPEDEPEDDIEVTDPPEVCHDCDEPNEPEFEDDEESLPQTSDINIGLYASMLLLLGVMLLKAKV
jgi:hypothetical protein